jgi:hypothetical protein
MRKSFEAIAFRIVDAENNFAETLMNLGGVDETTARKITALYLKKKLAKLDVGNGRIHVKHGAFLDARAIANAAKMVNAA